MSPSTRSSGTSPTPSPPTSAERAIRAATAAYQQAYLDAVADPTSTGKRQTLLAMYTADSPERAGVSTFLQTFSTKGWAGRRGTLDHQSIEQVTVPPSSPQGKAETITCTYDSGRVVDALNRAPDGSEIVVNDETQSYRTRWTWLLVAGEWKIVDATTLTTWPGADRCAAR
ncbi:hypothetical protein [Frankia sp. R82]|uniref:hypothetical protein n=1 Tax=Frankia sp. R82 TaxID=2950553 RepID=UPI0020439A71|nr:hypothetical protein [Frankia sp. R82]MCM3883549.1 hypothetical protein [Frankia sp. R82]